MTVCLHRDRIFLIWRLGGVFGGTFLGTLFEQLDIELPSFNVLASLLACNYNYKLGDLATYHPFIKLRHYLLDVAFDLVVRSNCSCREHRCIKWVSLCLIGKEDIPNMLRPYFLTLNRDLDDVMINTVHKLTL